MFVLSCVSLAVAVIVLSLSLLQYQNPNQTLLKQHESLEIILSLLLTGFFTFGFIGLFPNPVSTMDLVWAAIIAGTVVMLLKLLKVRERLAAYRAEQKTGRVVVGDFQPTSPANKPGPSYRKAA